jgi:anti-sigma-K factor RskA
MSPEEKSALAGEYVLRTLSDRERRKVESAMARDPELAAEIRNWEERLSGLATSTPPVEPPPALWSRINSAIDKVDQQRPRNGPRSAEFVTLRRRVVAWRASAVVAGALAAGLAAVVLAGPLMTTPPAAGERYVAIVNRGGDLPALLVNVDIATGIVAVRSVSAEAPPDRSYELWYIGEGQDPFSLGIVDRIGGELRVSIDDVRNFEPTEAVFAITDEPRGGSPTGAPTGPVVYTGVLLPAPE